MRFAKKVKELKNEEENKGKIVLVRCGIFVIATGVDAILLNQLYGLKVTCFEESVCKVGMPVGFILKYLELIEKEGYGYVLYDYAKDSKELVEKYKFEGKENSEKEQCKNCKEIILFNLKQEEYIMWLYEKLKTGTYKHSGYTTFYVTEPKVRLIEKSAYIDRIVHRWYVDNFMKEYFIKSFISTSYACLQNKGMHKACIDVQKTMKHCKRIWNNYYIIKMDVAKYFQNIDKTILYNILQRKIKDKKLLWLTREILYSNGIEKGLPIGNYTSQCFANIYLNELDQYAKHTLKLKYYFRYMDDIGNTKTTTN